MEYLTYAGVSDRLLTQGRTWEDGGLLHFNWTCAGFELTFRGTLLLADLVPGSSIEYEGIPGDTTAPSHENWPCVSVFLDGGDIPLRRFRVSEAGAYVLFQSSQPETHTLRVVKLTENLKTFLALRGLFAEGELSDPPRRREKVIEFLGDSITCGFGNEARSADPRFFDVEENGWMGHAALAARELGMDWRQVSVSGICLGPRREIPMPYAINGIYTDTDRPGQERLGLPVTPWDFKARPADYIVVNLGTNDATAIVFSDTPEAVEADYDRDYPAFLKLLRRVNGPGAHIVCAMGSMDYWLYPNVLSAVESYRRETGDENISILRYPRISPMDPPGAGGHPHVVTHVKMAAALTAHIRALESGRA